MTSEQLWQWASRTAGSVQRWMATHPRQRLALLAALFLALFAILGISLRQQWAELDNYAFSFEWQWLGIAACIYPLSILLQTWLWHEIMSETTGHDAPRDNFTAYHLVNLVRSLPGLAFHVTGRTLYYRRPPRQIAGRAVLRAIGVELLLLPLANLWCFLGVAIYGAERWPPGVRAPLLAALLVATLILVNGIARWHRVSRWVLWRWLLLMSLTFLNGLFYLWALIRGASLVPSDWVQLWYIWLLSSLVSVVATYLLGGISILRELTLSSLLSTVIPLPAAIAVAVWSRVIGMVSEALWSLLVLFILQGRGAWKLILRTTGSPGRES